MSDNNKYHEGQLLLHIAQGDQAAIKILFDQYYPRLYYFALKLTKDVCEAQDQAQEALLSLWQRRENFKDATMSEAEAFMITVVRNRAFNFNKHLRVRANKLSEMAESVDLSDDFLEAQLVQEDIFNRIYQEILALSPAHMELLKMIFIEGLETKEIAERLNTTSNNVRNQKARALEKLKTLLLRKGLYTPSVIIFYLFINFL